jgi:archaemetzincin
VPDGRLSDLIGRLESHLEAPVKLAEERIDPAYALDEMRRQYRSDLLLERLAGTGMRPGKMLGVTELDLFIPVLTFVFGEAQLNGRAAIVSSYRLRSEMYGLKADKELLMERLAKESLHELGHTYGLFHCYHPECVMQPSTYAELIDLKPAHFCSACEEKLAG